MADAKPRIALRLALGTAAVGLVWLVGVWPPPVWWRDHWPCATAMMRERAEPADLSRSVRTPRVACRDVHPTTLRDIPPLLQRMVIIAEDSRFRTHHGIDPLEIADAVAPDRGPSVWRTTVALWRTRDRLRGASTITQQLAKNLYLSSARNPLRKLKEAATALTLELALSKDRILELYLTVAEWGPGIWGAERASRAYYGVSATELSEEQAAALAATLPHPRSSNPLFRPERTLERRDLILARYRGYARPVPPDTESAMEAAMDSLELVVPPPAAPAPVPESLPTLPPPPPPPLVPGAPQTPPDTAAHAPHPNGPGAR